MKKISIVVPCFNEEENVRPLSEALVRLFRDSDGAAPVNSGRADSLSSDVATPQNSGRADSLSSDVATPQNSGRPDSLSGNGTAPLSGYAYELLFIDNDSHDRTRDLLRDICASDPNIKAILNAKNFGQFNSPYYAMLQTTGDCTVLMAADFQDPVELLPQYVKAWEEGNRVVIGIKKSSQESKPMYWLRSCYYKLIKKLSNVEQIEHFTGFGLYDAKFIDVLRKLDDPTPFLRGIVAELGFRRKEIPYEQPRRRAGKTSNNWYSLYDAAMLSITSYTKVGLRLATVFGCLCSFTSMAIALIYLIMKLIWWDRFPAGMAPMLIGMLFLGSIQIFFIGLVGEYILTINARVMKRPLVIEEERINL